MSNITRIHYEVLFCEETKKSKSLFLCMYLGSMHEVPPVSTKFSALHLFPTDKNEPQFPYIYPVTSDKHRDLMINWSLLFSLNCIIIHYLLKKEGIRNTWALTLVWPPCCFSSDNNNPWRSWIIWAIRKPLKIKTYLFPFS